MKTTRREAFASLAAMVGGSALVSAQQTAGAPAAKPLTRPAAPAVPRKLASVSDFEPLARQRMSHMAYEYVSGGAGDELTLRDNIQAFDRLRLHPRVLVDVSELDTRTTILGQALEFPILMAPTAYHRIMHPEGELATVRGAAKAGATMIASSFATTTIEDMSRAAKGPLWFQLYCVPDRGFTKELVQRAENAGCKALFVTVDTPVTGNRHRETRVGFALPPGLDRANYRSLGGTASTTSHRPSEREIYSVVLDPTLTWKEIEWIRSFARVPVVIKGVLSPLDAAKAVSAGRRGDRRVEPRRPQPGHRPRHHRRAAADRGRGQGPGPALPGRGSAAWYRRAEGPRPGCVGRPRRPSIPLRARGAGI